MPEEPRENGVHTDIQREELVRLIAEKGGSITPRELARCKRAFMLGTLSAREELNKLARDGVGMWHYEYTGTRGRPRSVFILTEYPNKSRVDKNTDGAIKNAVCIDKNTLGAIKNAVSENNGKPGVDTRVDKNTDGAGKNATRVDKNTSGAQKTGLRKPTVDTRIDKNATGATENAVCIDKNTDSSVKTANLTEYENVVFEQKTALGYYETTLSVHALCLPPSPAPLLFSPLILPPLITPPTTLPPPFRECVFSKTRKHMLEPPSIRITTKQPDEAENQGKPLATGVLFEGITEDDLSGGMRLTERVHAELAERVWENVSWRKVGKGAAIIAIRRAAERYAINSGTKDLRAAYRFLADKAREYSDSLVVATTDRTFLPHPTTWFNQDRFLDSEEEWRVNRKKSMTYRDVPIGKSSFDILIEQVLAEEQAEERAKAARGSPPPCHDARFEVPGGGVGYPPSNGRAITQINRPGEPYMRTGENNGKR